jgi:3-phenylpropionate/trans-cinnamate dioxygenase ferredoxin reductase subunit
MHVVIAGGGLAGLRTIEELRGRGFSGPITMIAAEGRPPYDRPPLSKQALAPVDLPGETPASEVLAAEVLAGEVLAGEPDAAAIGAELDTTLQADFTALDVDLRLGEPATGLELASAPGPDGPGGLVRTARGEYPFDRLVVATGAEPVALPGPGRQRFLRTHEDASELRARLKPGTRLVIVGAGWIGAELATAAAARGCRVTVLEAGPAPLAGAIGADVGARTAPWYAAAGVELRTSQAVESVQDGGLALAGGDWLPADEVVTAVGVRPAVAWLAGSGVQLDNGVAADEGLRTSAPGVFAVGDCASFLSVRYGRRLRFEHWDVALNAPAVVAANILGAQEVYDPVPYSWSEQFGRMLQYAGYYEDGSQLAWRGSPDAGADAAQGTGAGAAWGQGADADPGPGQGTGGPWTACWLSGGRLVAVLAVDRPRDLTQGRRVIASGARVDVGLLTDPAVPLRNATVN